LVSAHFQPFNCVQGYGIMDRSTTLHALILSWHNQVSRRKGLRALACALVFLGVCVFAWGLRYKLSLYDPPHSVSHRMPAAKLLTGRERTQVPPLNLHRDAGSTGPAVLVALTLAFISFSGAALLFPRFSPCANWLPPVHLAQSRQILATCWTRPPPQSR
jgi:hypothetical protein